VVADIAIRWFSGKRRPGPPARAELLRQCLAWALDVIDDFTDTTMDEEVTQLTLRGGLYIAAKDYCTLCCSCRSCARVAATCNPRAASMGRFSSRQGPARSVTTTRRRSR
jgi:hypothetical protein